jgi:hypothetical protein
VAFICEVKSLTDENETSQMRLPIGQVLDYVHALDSLREAGSLPPHWEGIHTVRAPLRCTPPSPSSAGFGCGEGDCDDGLAHAAVFFSFDCAG